MTGPIARQGPHHSAQKSTTVSLSDDITFSWKLVSVNSKAINKRFLCDVIIFTIQRSTNFVNFFVVFPTLWVVFRQVEIFFVCPSVPPFRTDCSNIVPERWCCQFGWIFRFQAGNGARPSLPALLTQALSPEKQTF